MQIRDLKYLRCTDETLQDRIKALKLSNYNKELKISQQLYLMYNDSEYLGDNILILGTSKATMRQYAIESVFKNRKFLSPFIQEISGVTFTVEGGKLTIRHSGKVINTSLAILFQSISILKENRAEIHNRFLKTRGKKPCYYFIGPGSLAKRRRDYGCSVADALNEPAKVVDAWTEWVLFHFVDYEHSVIDEDGNDVTQQLIPQSTINTVEKLDKNIFSAGFRTFEFKDGIQLVPRSQTIKRIEFLGSSDYDYLSV